jgi:hypothetical protein
VRDARFRKASILGFACARFGDHQPEFLGERRIRHIQFVGRLDNRLVHRRTSLEADDEQIEEIGKPVVDGPLTLADLPGQPEPGQLETERARDQHERPRLSEREPDERHYSQDDRHDELHHREDGDRRQRVVARALEAPPQGAELLRRTRHQPRELLDDLRFLGRQRRGFEDDARSPKRSRPSSAGGARASRPGARAPQ